MYITHKNINFMPVAPKKYTKILQTPISKIQFETLQKLKGKNIKIPNFVREAIREKINLEYSELRFKHKEVKCPF